MSQTTSGRDVRSLVELHFTGETKERILSSLLVPQAGEYHNEGALMESHLTRMLLVLAEVLAGKFPAVIPAVVQTFLIAQAILSAKDLDRVAEVERYILLHDIEKANSMTVTLLDGTERSFPWSEWTSLLDSAGPLPEDGALRNRFAEQLLAEQGIVKISYFRAEEIDGKPVRVQHGDLGARFLRDKGISERILRAIETHEVAYLFTDVNVPTYERIFGAWSAGDRLFALLGSYLDTAASLRPNGEPDFGNFLCLAKSYMALQTFREILMILGAGRVDASAIEELQMALATNARNKMERFAAFASVAAKGRADPRKLERMLWKLRESSDLAIEDAETLANRLLAETKVAGYDAANVRTELGFLVTDSSLTTAEFEELVALITGGGVLEIGKRFGGKIGRRMKEVQAALKRAEA